MIHYFSISAGHLLALLLVLRVTRGQDTLTKLYFNECDPDKSEYELGVDAGYNLNVRDKTIQDFKAECSMYKFVMSKTQPVKWFCVRQAQVEEEWASILDDSILKVYGESNGRRIDVFNITKDSRWFQREICGEFPTLFVSLTKPTGIAKIDLSKVSINLDIVHIQSTRRIFYFNGTYCGLQVRMFHSDIQLLDAIPGEKNPLAKTCIIDLVRLSPGGNLSFIFATTPAGACTEDDTENQWSFITTIYGKNQGLEFNCNNTSGLIAWTAPPALPRHRFIAKRGNATGVKSRFKLQVSDNSNYTEEEFREKGEKLKKDLNDEEEKDEKEDEEEDKEQDEEDGDVEKDDGNQNKAIFLLYLIVAVSVRVLFCFA